MLVRFEIARFPVLDGCSVQTNTAPHIPSVWEHAKVCGGERMVSLSRYREIFYQVGDRR